MSIVKLNKENFQHVTLVTHPRRTFTSSSAPTEGTSGSIFVFPQRSGVVKDPKSVKLRRNSSFTEDTTPLLELDAVVHTAHSLLSDSPTGAHDISGVIIHYIGGYSVSTDSNHEDGLTLVKGVNNFSSASRFSKQVEITRHEPTDPDSPGLVFGVDGGSFSYNKNVGKKSAIRKTLFPFYRAKYPSLQYNFSNYNVLNFYKSSETVDDSAIIYPAMTSSDGTNPYCPTGDFTFEFYINPRYTNTTEGEDHFPGTIMHMSSSFAVSLITGSLKSDSGKVEGFKLMLQLSSSTETAPSMIPTESPNLLGRYPYEFVFTSSDNSLRHNHWHHVAIRWGGSDFNAGQGSFVIDGVEDSVFTITSSNVTPGVSGDPANLHDPNALFIGNFYEGYNDTTGSVSIDNFFYKGINATHGLDELTNSTTDISSSAAILANTLNHPLQAEIHDIRIYDSYQTIDQISTSLTTGPSDYSSKLKFYLPVLFTKESPRRDILLTPFESSRNRNGTVDTRSFKRISTTKPFNSLLSSMAGGFEVNVDNFVREFRLGTYPRLYNLQYPRENYSVASHGARSANEVLNGNKSHKKRNLSLLPSDNGKFIPNFNLLKSGSVENNPDGLSIHSEFINDQGSLDLTVISLNNIVTSSYLDNVHSGSALAEIATPEDPNREAAGLVVLHMQSSGSLGVVPTMVERTFDVSSNEISMYNFSNLFYGNRIKPGTLVMVDEELSGSGDKINITLHDDGNGNLYRANAKTPHAKWNSVGNILYDEGICIVKSPHIRFFGKDQYKLKFRGEQNVHVLEIRVPSSSGLVNSSSNPTFSKLKPSDYKSAQEDSDFVYITGINFHDENLNVVARTNLAQPVVKREDDGYLFKVKLDF